MYNPPPASGPHWMIPTRGRGAQNPRAGREDGGHRGGGEASGTVVECQTSDEVYGCKSILGRRMAGSCLCSRKVSWLLG